MTSLHIQIVFKAIFIDSNINLITDLNQLKDAQEITSNNFYELRNEKNPFHHRNKSIYKPKLGFHPTMDYVNSTCYTPLMIHCYLTSSSLLSFPPVVINNNNNDNKINKYDNRKEEGANEEKELILSDISIMSENKIMLSFFQDCFKGYNLQKKLPYFSHHLPLQYYNINEVNLNTVDFLPLDMVEKDYNLIIQVYLSMLSEYSVMCGVDFGKITLNLFDLKYLLECYKNPVLSSSSSSEDVSKCYSFKSLNNVILLRDGTLLLFLDIFPLVNSTISSYLSSGEKVIIINNLNEKEIFFKGENVEKLSKEHSKIVLSVDILNFGPLLDSSLSSTSTLSSLSSTPSSFLKNQGISINSGFDRLIKSTTTTNYGLNEIFLISKLFDSSSSLSPRLSSSSSSSSSSLISTHYNNYDNGDNENNHRRLSIDEIGQKWNYLCDMEKKDIYQYMLKYKHFTYKFDREKMSIFMPKSDNLICITTPSQNTYYNTGISLPIFTYVLEKSNEISRLTNESLWLKMVYLYGKHFLIEYPQWINNFSNHSNNSNNNNKNNKKMKNNNESQTMNYLKLQQLERDLPKSKTILENWILKEFFTIFYKSSIEDQISHTMNIIMWYVHVYLEYISDYTISTNGTKTYIEIFGDALKLRSGDCEDLTGAGLELYSSFMGKEYDSPHLKYMKTLLMPYVPLLLIEGSSTKNLDSVDASTSTTNTTASTHQEEEHVNDNNNNKNYKAQQQQKKRQKKYNNNNRVKPPEITAGHSSLKLIPIPYFINMIKNWNSNSNYSILEILTKDYDDFLNYCKVNNLDFYNWLSDSNFKHELPILIGEGTGMLESGTIRDYELDGRTMVNCCLGVEKLRKKFYLPDEDRYQSPFYVALFIGVTNYFIKKGFNQGLFYFATKNPEKYYKLDDDNSNSNSNNTQSPFGKGVIFSDFMKKCSFVTLIPNLSSSSGIDENEINFITGKQFEKNIANVIKKSIINRTPLPILEEASNESNKIAQNLKQYINNMEKKIFNFRRTSLSSTIYCVVSHYVFQEYIDDELFENIYNYFDDWNSIIFNQESIDFEVSDTIKRNIKMSNLYLKDFYVHLECDPSTKKTETCLNAQKEVYRFDFIIGKINN